MSLDMSGRRTLPITWTTELHAPTSWCSTKAGVLKDVETERWVPSVLNDKVWVFIVLTWTLLLSVVDVYTPLVTMWTLRICLAAQIHWTSWYGNPQDVSCKYKMMTQTQSSDTRCDVLTSFNAPLKPAASRSYFVLWIEFASSSKASFVGANIVRAA